jgi:hypothetical protein
MVLLRRTEDAMAGLQTFTTETWDRLSGIVASAYSMSPAKAAELKENVTARLIASIPYEAGCREPERTALAHVAVYVLAASEAARRAFDHKPSDDYDVLARLAAVASFEGGDPAIINRGMKTLAILLIEGYKKDVASDEAKGWYNPVGAGAWDADALLGALRASIGAAGDAAWSQDLVARALADGWWS